MRPIVITRKCAPSLALHIARLVTPLIRRPRFVLSPVLNHGAARDREHVAPFATPGHGDVCRDDQQFPAQYPLHLPPVCRRIAIVPTPAELSGTI